MVMASTLTLAFNWRKKVRIRSGLSPKNERARAPFPTRHFSATFNVILMRNPSWKWCRRFRYTLQRIGSAIYVSDVQDDECDGTDGDISTKVAALELICLMRVRELDRIKRLNGGCGSGGRAACALIVESAVRFHRTPHGHDTDPQVAPDGELVPWRAASVCV